MTDAPSSLDAFIARLPKVELHLHLEGSIRPGTLEELAARKSWLKQKVADWVSERQRESYRYGSFERFLAAYVLVAQMLEAPEDYALATTRLIEWLAVQHVKYAEVTLSAGVILWKKQPLDAIFEAMAQATSEAGERCGVRVHWIFDAIRQFGADHARAVLEWASRFLSQGVVAFGIGGDEIRGPAALFVGVYRQARDLGLHVTAHAGETAGPASIRDAVELLRAERIGHGLTLLRDPSVVDVVRARGIPLEVCPTSNVATGLIADFEGHPLPQFLGAGLKVTVNSDDPAMFGTSLEGEFQLAARTFGLSSRQIVELGENAIGATFLPEDEQAVLLRELHAAAAF